MSAQDYSIEDCKAFLLRHKETIVQIVSMFYAPDSYDYHAMVCDFSTYLWEVYCRIPSSMEIRDESAWIYAVIYREALNFHRGESRRQSRLVYGADITQMASDNDNNHNIKRLYQLVDRLNGDERDMLLMYIDKVPTSEMANYYCTTPLTIRRRIRKICDKLRRLARTLDDDDFDS